MNARYEVEELDSGVDDGTMPENVAKLSGSVVGRKIVSAERAQVTGSRYELHTVNGLILTLDDGTSVEVADTDDCCAYTELESFLLNPTLVDHIIMGVGTTEGYSVWHIYADAGDVLKLTVNWSAGNIGYYGYGFHIKVKPKADDE